MGNLVLLVILGLDVFEVELLELCFNYIEDDL